MTQMCCCSSKEPTSYGTLSFLCTLFFKKIVHTLHDEFLPWVSSSHAERETGCHGTGLIFDARGQLELYLTVESACIQLELGNATYDWHFWISQSLSSTLAGLPLAVLVLTAPTRHRSALPCARQPCAEPPCRRRTPALQPHCRATAGGSGQSDGSASRAA